MLPYLPPGNQLVPVVAFVGLPLCSWFWIERRVVPRWRAKLGVAQTLGVPAPGLKA
jgi:hypothetical protein